MTLDETIYCEKNHLWNSGTVDHKQIAKWLEDYKKLKESIAFISNRPIEDIYLEAYNNAIDNFAKKLKSDELQKHNLDMVFETSRDLSYSNCINAFEEYVDSVAEQLKSGK